MEAKQLSFDLEAKRGKGEGLIWQSSGNVRTSLEKPMSGNLPESMSWLKSTSVI